jgi:ABC-type phosphonate transport system ATPase subunit
MHLTLDANSTAPILKVNALSIQSAERLLVDQLSFELHAGQTLALVGESTKTQINKILQLRPSLFCLNRLKPACKMGDISLSLANQNVFADQSTDTTHRQLDAAASPTK